VYEFKRVNFTVEDLASLQTRKKLREKLQCKNFDWYMYNIIPEVETPPTDAVYYGEIMNLQSRACFEMTSDYYVGMTYLCYEHKIIPRNNFRLTEDGLLKYKDKCVRAISPRPILFLDECPGQETDRERYGIFKLLPKGHTWGQIEFRTKNDEGGLAKFCLLQVTNVLEEHNREQMPQLANCDASNGFSMWAFSYKFDYKA
jgi:polypeptide N-acetylgalactosaminyltransferase